MTPLLILAAASLACAVAAFGAAVVLERVVAPRALLLDDHRAWSARAEGYRDAALLLATIAAAAVALAALIGIVGEVGA